MKMKKRLGPKVIFLTVLAVILFVPFWNLPIIASSWISQSQAADTEHAEFTMQIYTLPPGSTNYVMAWAISDLLKKYSPWLRAMVQVGHGPDFMKLMHREPKQTKSAIGVMMPDNVWYAKNELKIKDVKPMVVFRAHTNVTGLLTMNPNIRTPQDLIGKRVALGKAGTATYSQFEVLFKYGWEIWDKVKIEALSFGPNMNALLDGTVDVGQYSITVLEEKSSPAPNTTELVASGRKLYPVNTDEASAMKASKKTGRDIVVYALPPDTLGEGGTEPCLGLENASYYWATPELPEDVVHELLRVVWDNIDKLKDYHDVGNFWSRDNLSDVAGYHVEFHPMARKFYMEKGVKLP